MANPFADKVKSSSQSKFKGITGKQSSGQNHPDGGSNAKAAAFKKGKSGPSEYKVGGAVSAPRLDQFARGGKAKGKGHKGTNIKIAVIAPGGKPEDKMAGPGSMPPGMPPGMPPKMPMAMPPPGAGPGGPPPGLPPGMPPGPMKRGGMVKMKAGAGTGEGRLDKISAYGKNARKG